MASKLYPAILVQADTGYAVSFPDLPDCTASGRTMEDAEIAAEEALSDYLFDKARSGTPIPSPSWMGSIGYDPNSDETAVILVRAVMPEVPAFVPEMAQAA